MINLPFWKRKVYLHNQIDACTIWLEIHDDEANDPKHSCSDCRDKRELLLNMYKDLRLANAVDGLETHLAATTKHEAKFCEMCIHHIEKIESLTNGETSAGK